MSVQLTAFGQFTRKLRIDHGERLQDMANRLGITISYLSAVERGLRNTPYDWADRLQRAYNLSDDATKQVKQAVAVSRIQGKLDMTHLSFKDKELMANLMVSLPTLSLHEKEQLYALMGKDRCK